MYKILHIPTANLIYGKVEWYTASELLDAAQIDIKNTNTHGFAPLLFDTEESCHKYINRHDSYAYDKNENYTCLYLGEYPGYLITPEHFEIIEVENV